MAMETTETSTVALVVQMEAVPPAAAVAAGAGEVLGEGSVMVAAAAVLASAD